MRSENWYDSILRAISDFIERLFRNTTSGVFDARDLIILFAAIVVVAVLVYFLRNLRRSLVAEESLPTALMEQEARTPAEDPIMPSALSMRAIIARLSVNSISRPC